MAAQTNDTTTRRCYRCPNVFQGPAKVKHAWCGHCDPRPDWNGSRGRVGGRDTFALYHGLHYERIADARVRREAMRCGGIGL